MSDLKFETSEGAEVSGSTESTLFDFNYTPEKNSIQEGQEAFEKLLEALPEDLKKAYQEFHRKKITERLGAGGDPAIEGLLPEIKTIDSAEILGKSYPDMPWIVPDYLPPGLTILSGRPKVGKSWLGFQLALSMMTGGKMFNRDIKKGKVLYLALEDSERRLKDRMSKQDWPKVFGGVTFMLFDEFHREIGSLDSGGGKRLMKYIEKCKFRAVIVDTFSRAIASDQLDNSAMTEAIGPLQQQALSLDLGLVMIDHMRKFNGRFVDPIEDVFGSTAKAGILDTTWGLYKEQGKPGAKLGITGRDVDSYELKLTFQQSGFYWHLEGDAYDVEMTERRKEILDVVEDLGTVTMSQIVEAVKADFSNTSRRVNDLCRNGLLIRSQGDGKAYYRLPGEEIED